MAAAVPRNIITVLAVALFAGCGARPAPPTTIAAASRVTKPVLLPPGPSTQKYEAYGPMQYFPFTGVNRENIYMPATAPTTGPVDDSVLLPTDDEHW